VIAVIPNIILVGFMGCGKSSVGRRLAALAGHRFLDTDDLVVENEGLSIPEIFSAAGEEGFRLCEEAALADLDGVTGIVLSTGGGIILRETNRERIRRLGIVIWLDADPEILFERATRSGRRPLLQTADPRARFLGLLESRRPLYTEVSDARVDSGNLTHDEAAQSILDAVMRVQNSGRQVGGC